MTQLPDATRTRQISAALGLPVDPIDLDGARLQVRSSLGTVLLEFELGAPAFELGAPGEALAEGLPLLGTALTTGDAASARLVTAAGAVVLDAHTVGTASATPAPEVVLSSLSIVEGREYALIAYSVEVPSGAS